MLNLGFLEFSLNFRRYPMTYIKYREAFFLGFVCIFTDDSHRAHRVLLFLLLSYDIFHYTTFLHGPF